jgi:hypothetical protein
VSDETAAEFDPEAALTRALKQMANDAQAHETNRDYHEGRHPRLEWITKIKKVFGQDVADQVHQMNYCAKAIDAPLSRMGVDGFDDATADELFRLNGCHLSQRDLYSDCFIIREGFVILAEAEPGSLTPYDIVVQRAEDCYVEPGSLKPGDRAWAVKVSADPTLVDSEGKMSGGYRAWVWDEVDYYKYVAPVGDPDKTPIPSSADAFEPDIEDPTGPHGFDRVPVVPFRMGREPKSRLDPLRPIQDRIDMLEIGKVVAGIFGASKQRVFFTRQELAESDVEASPDFAIVLDPGDKEEGQARVDEFEATPLENFDKGIDAEIDRFYEIASLPKHGRMNVAGSASGEAKKADDGEFVEMIEGYQAAFDEAWREVFALLGIDTEPVWKDANVRNEVDQITVVKTAVDAGVPLPFALKRWFDFTEDDLAELNQALVDQKAQDAQAREAAMTASAAGLDPTQPGVLSASQLGG